MHNLSVRLIKKATDALNGVATALETDSEGAFEYVVRNALKVYHVVELEGHIRLIDSVGNMQLLRFLDDNPGPGLLDKLVAKFLRKPEPKTKMESEVFSALLDDEVVDDVALQAKVYGFTPTDLYNRLVIIGSLMAVHLQDGQAFAYSKTGDALGKIEFTAR